MKVLSENELSKLKNIELNMLCEIDKICREYQIRYSIAAGTLLGAARHKGFIPWDDDIDIMMYREDYCKLKECITLYSKELYCNGVQREHNKKLNNGLPILHKVPPKRDYGRYFCIMAEKGGTSHGGLTEKLSPFFHAKKQEVNAYGR